MNTVKKDPGSDIWGAVLRFEEITNRLCRIERLMRLLASSQCVSESDADAIEGLADLVDSCRLETVNCQDEFAALSGTYRETANG